MRNTGIDKSKHFLWIVVALVIAGTTIAIIFSQSETMTVEELRGLLRNGHPGWLILAFIFMGSYFVFEGLSLNTLLRSIGCKSSLKQGIVYGATDAYFSGITPSATGGQPAVMYFMIKYGVPMAAAVAILIINLILYTVSTVLIGLLVTTFFPRTFLEFSFLSRVIIVVGGIAVTGLGVGLVLLLKKGEWMANILIKLVGLGNKLGFIKDTDQKIEKIRSLEKDYTDAEKLISGKPGTLIKAGFYNLMQRISHIWIPVFMDLAVGQSTGKSLDIFAVQCYVTVGANCIPIPGAMGAYDYLMIDGYHSLMSPERVYRIALLSRGLSFYLCMIISSIIVLIAYLGMKRREKKQEIPYL